MQFRIFIMEFSVHQHYDRQEKRIIFFEDINWVFFQEFVAA